ncbi:dolichyl-phosphate-mannose-protein mannosyltransferase [Entomortierella parvispora]|uniref:dolichyl-phosphate-mannose--protein mannosyltransferase n=1 Tax=Entomortierella parvispora TaxID=205924 RepID=A0A9P3HI26_9FUNG|nr:dolichyl-phosphate-mannose-protein mannosyltransferase [Entomortierella parvispora]
MSFGGYNPAGSSDLPFSSPGGSGMRSRASSVSSVHSTHSTSSAAGAPPPPPPPTNQQQQQQSPYQSPYNSRPGTPLGKGGDGYFGANGASGYGAAGYDVGYASGSSSPASVGPYHSPTPPAPNQQRQSHYGYGAGKQTASSGYDSPAGVSSSVPSFYGADLQQQHQRHSRSHSNASETSLNIDTGGLGGLNDGTFSPGLGSGHSSASSSRRGSVSSESGSIGSFFGRKIGKTFRPPGPEPHQAPEDYYGSENDDGSDSNLDLDLDHDMSDPETRKKALIMRTRMAKSSSIKGFRGGRGGGRMRDLFNDWDLLLPNTKADPYEEEDDDGLNEDEKWKKRQMVKRGWESPRGQIILLTLLTLLAVFVRIWKLAIPSAVVFDEQHFGGFAADYIRGEFFMDLHPPLGKMLFAAVASMLRFNGNFHFAPGSLYPKTVPFIGMRLFAVACGAGLIPVAYMTIRRSGHSTQAAFTAAILITFENAMITQSRFILLDAPMMLFMGYTLLTWINFYNHRNRPFTRGWWIWLVQTGFGLFLSSSVKWVGLFTIATIGVCVIKYLQEARTHLYISTREFSKQFIALFFCLLLMPVVLYLGLHAVDFAILSKSGSGNAWVSPQFQMTLKGHDVVPVMADIAWDSKVRIRHANTNGGWIHSMPGETTRESAKDQAIQLVEWDDELTCWHIYPADPSLKEQHAQHKFERKYDPSIQFQGYIYDGDEIRLRHCYTKVALATNDIESVGSNKTFLKEVRGIKWSKKPTKETVWRLELVPEGSVPGLADYHGLEGKSFSAAKGGSSPKVIEREMRDPVVNSKDEKSGATLPARDENKQWHSIKGFRLYNEKQKCYLQSSKVFRAPYSTYQEVGCIQGGRQKANTIFIVDENINPHLPKRATSLSYRPLTFFQKFKELNRVMWWTHHDLSAPVHGDEQTRRPSDESHPWTWPLMRRGMNYYASKETNHYVHFIGNPLLWWAATGAVAFYVASCLLSVYQFLRSKNITATSSAMGRHRGKQAERDRFGVTPFYAVASGTFFAGWAIHYLPFFFMSRQVFLHHYLPALYFSILLLVSRLDRLWSSWPALSNNGGGSSSGGSTLIVTSGRMRFLVGVGLMAAMIMSWWMFSPLSYGTDFATKAQCQRLQALGGWNFICQRQDLPWARPDAAAAAAAAEAEAARKREEDEEDDDESHFYYNDADDHNSVEGSIDDSHHGAQQQSAQEDRRPDEHAQQQGQGDGKIFTNTDPLNEMTANADSRTQEALEKQQLKAEKEALEEKQRQLEARLAAQEQELEQQRLLQKQRELEQQLLQQQQEQARQQEQQRQQQQQVPSEPTREMLEEQVRILQAQLESNRLKQLNQHQQQNQG